jgi:hypothetical protein
MPARAIETMASRRFHVGENGSNTTLDYVILEAETEDEAYACIAAEVPTKYAFIPRTAFDFDPLGNDAWTCQINYRPNKIEDRPPAGESGQQVGDDPGPQGSESGGGNVAAGFDPERKMGRQVSWSTAGGTKHIVKDISTIQKLWSDGTPGGGIAPDCSAIGFSRSGVEGLDVIAGNPEIVVTIQCPEMSLGYFCRLNAMTGTVNSTPFNGFEEGELLMLGSDGAWVDSDSTSTGETGQPGHWNITFRFKYSPNRHQPDTDVGDMALGFVRGWDLIDVIYKEEATQFTEDEDDIVLIQVPEFCYVRQVYPYEDFDQLGLDDGFFEMGEE